MSHEKLEREERAIKIVDGFITVEVVRREKKPSDKNEKKRNILKILKGKRE